MGITVKITEHVGGCKETYAVPADSWERVREIERETKLDLPRGSTVEFKYEKR